MKYIVSACLAGESCRYDGKDNLVEEVKKLVEEGVALPFCPEDEGGLPTPRTPCEIQHNSDGELIVMSAEGIDCTKEFLLGAKKAVVLCKKHKITQAILKAKSPSCGSKKIYDGTFSATLKEGVGMCTKLLQENGVTVENEIHFLEQYNL